MGVKTGSDFSQNDIETSDNMLRPCAGGIPKSLKEKPFDPSAWYIAQVKRHNELVCRKILNDPDRFPYKVEAYVAAQQELVYRANRTRHIKERVVISGKVFIRVDQRHRQDVLKQCLLLSRYVMDPSASPTASGYTPFARVPDWEIQRLRDIFNLADGPVEYTDTPLVPMTRSRCLQVPSMASGALSQMSRAINTPRSSWTPSAPSLSASLSPTSPNFPMKSDSIKMDMLDGGLRL